MPPEGFAARWQAAWNAHDLDEILSHYSDDIVFRSRKALALTGAGTILGKAALRAYWSAALAAQPDLHFTVTQVYIGHETIVIAYRNHRGVKAAETLTFGADGLATMASACHA